ncbi:MAG: Tol-Pal system protein TolB [Chroococcopsis gigantea SAG 12.99]|jgi:Tol biopolymer transport system component|nr:TolB family protein [Chlorogloea purpurea SAG 13.99]MDV2999179.1 Tol-Pal system protein TolB [Chroococcopsis gigantea SAG 12.99]
MIIKIALIISNTLLLTGLLSSCTFNPEKSDLAGLNSRYNEEDPTLSGDGRWLAFVSGRRGSREILLYDLQERKFDDLDGLYTGQEIADTPSLSRTARYLTYLVTIDGRPEIALYDRLTRRSDLLTQNYRNSVKNPQISPDGRYIVFSSSRRGQWDIEVLDRGPNIELDIADGTLVDAPDQ